MTNPLTNIAGVYEITIDRIAFDTGYDERTLRPMIDKFSKAGKAHFYNDEWMILPSWPRHQQYESRSKIRTGIEAVLKKLDGKLIDYLKKVGYEYPMDSISIPYTYPSNYSDSDSDSDLDTDRDSREGAVAPPPEDPGFDDFPVKTDSRPNGVQKDPLAQSWEDAITKIQPHETWSHYGKERKQCRNLAQRTRGILEKSPYQSGEEVINAVLREYQKLRQQNRNPYWSGAAVTPSAIMTRWPDVWTSLAQSHAEDEVLTL